MEINLDFLQYYKSNNFISDIADDVKVYMVDMAIKSKEYKWEPLLASDYLLYEYTGDRKTYETIYFRKRKTLTFLVIGFLITKEEEYLMPIVNGVYSICEESTWVVPAHNQLLEEVKDAIIHDPDYPVIDLFSSETGGLLSFTYYLLQEELDKITPLIRKRIKRELERRIIIPYLYEDRFWWMGLRKELLGDRILNNWNPWCNMNSLITLLLVEEKKDYLKLGIEKCISSVKAYLEVQTEDGGCSEGTSYWGHASGNLYFICLYLYRASNGEVNLFAYDKVKKMALYIYKAHISKEYFLPYADCDIKNTEIPISLLYLYGSWYKQLGLTKMAKTLYKNPKEYIDKNSWLSLGKVLLELEISKELQDEFQEVVQEIQYKDVWFKDAQIMCTREKENDRGFFLSCKGSHNGESHNHNDVGNYVVYYDGKPLIIDVGVESYRKDTFSDNRYNIWTMQSGYHNLPIINGYMQENGSQYTSKNIMFRQEKERTSLSLDIQEAYEVNIGINTWKRTCSLDRVKTTISIVETIDFNRDNNKVTFVMMVLNKPILKKKGILELLENEKVYLSFPEGLLDMEVEEINIQDKRLRRSLPESIFRIKFFGKFTTGKQEIIFTIYR